MQTALHILSLVKELQQEIVGGTIRSTEFYRKQRAAYFFVKTGKSTTAISFLFHPHGAGTFCVPASKVRLDGPEKSWPVFKLEGCTVAGVSQVGLDRILRVDFQSGDEKSSVVIEALGPNGNIWLLDADLRRKAVLRNRDFTDGEKYDPPATGDRLDPRLVDATELRSRLEAGQWPSMLTFIEKNIIGFNRTLAKETVHRADLDFADLAEVTNDDLVSIATTIIDIANRFASPENGYLYRLSSGVEVYPFKLSAVDQQPEKHKTLSLAVQAMTSMRQEHIEVADEEKTVTDTVKRAVKRLERRVVNLEKDLDSASDYEKYKKYGELLQINLPSIRKGQTEVELDDIYEEPSRKVTIALDQKLSPQGNAEEYFKKHRKGREGLELLQRRLQVTRDELGELRKMQQALETHFESARQRYDAEIESILPQEGVKRGEQIRLPYREYTLPTGVKIFVGRDGSDNDRTTFEFARPYELWFHAQQCPGSHVVIKFPNKSFEPSKLEIELTAAIAAWFSKARNDTMVPVVYAERRYVRKPRKAKPGLVTVEREKSVMVEPKKPEEE